MNGISLVYWSEREAAVYQRSCSGWWLSYPDSSEDGWRSPVFFPDDKVESTMAQIEEITGHRETGLDGFTLFQTAKGWQMSCRRKGEPGWDIKIVPDKDAQTVLSMLEASGHPDGPITIRSSKAAGKRRLGAAMERLTAALLSEVAL